MRRPWRGQAHASGAAHPRSEAKYRWRLLRARGVQVQPGHVGRADDVQPGEGAALLARVALERSPRDGAPRDSLRDRSAEDRPDFAAGGESQTRQLGRQGGGFRRNRATHRALLPPLPAARRGEFTDGGVARQSDGRAHLSRLPGREGPRHPAAVHHRGQDHSRRRAAQLRRAARLSRHAQAGRTRCGRRPAGPEGDSTAIGITPGHRVGLSELQPALGHALGR